jgi:hypothetical protein
MNIFISAYFHLGTMHLDGCEAKGNCLFSILVFHVFNLVFSSPWIVLQRC